MNPTPIFKDHTGRWRPVNPHSPGHLVSNELAPGYEENPAYVEFEQSIQYHKFPNAPEVKPGEVVMAYLQWQFYNKYGEYWTDCSQKTAEDYCNGQETRQIWVAANQSEKPFWEKAHDILVDGREASRGNDVRGKEEKKPNEKCYHNNLDVSFNGQYGRCRDCGEILSKHPGDKSFKEIKKYHLPEEGMPEFEDNIENAAFAKSIQHYKKVVRENNDFIDGAIFGANWQKEKQPKSDHITDTGVSAESILDDNCTSLSAWSWNRKQAVLKAMEQYATLKAQSLIADKQFEIERLRNGLIQIKNELNDRYNLWEADRDGDVPIDTLIDNILKEKP